MVSRMSPMNNITEGHDIALLELLSPGKSPSSVQKCNDVHGTAA
jgi:hypothetical protein